MLTFNTFLALVRLFLVQGACGTQKQRPGATSIPTAQEEIPFGWKPCAKRSKHAHSTLAEYFPLESIQSKLNTNTFGSLLWAAEPSFSHSLQNRLLVLLWCLKISTIDIAGASNEGILPTHHCTTMPCLNTMPSVNVRNYQLGWRASFFPRNIVPTFVACSFET